MTPDKAWKQFERDVAKLVGGRRYPANLGGGVDVDSPLFVIQCKNVKTMPLAKLEAVAREIEREGVSEGKIGVVCIKRRAGGGVPTPTLFVFTEDMWRALVARVENLVQGERGQHDTNGSPGECDNGKESFN